MAEPLRRPDRPPRVAAIGLASWDRLIVVDRYPGAGSYAIVDTELEGPGGTTANAAVALARLGAAVSLRAHVGEDQRGAMLVAALRAAGVDVSGMTVKPGEPTDAATVVVSRRPPDRTIFWHQGARLARGDRLDIPYLFGHDVVLLDVDDAPLRRFLVDLPAHTLPTARLLGTLTYLEAAGIPDAFDLVMRHDAIVGNERELCAVTSQPDLDGAVAAVRVRMRGENLRTAIVTRSDAGAVAFSIDACWEAPAFPTDVVDTTGAGDAFAGAIAYAMACRWPWPDALRFANAVAARCVAALGAQTVLPGWDEVAALLEDQP